MPRARDLGIRIGVLPTGPTNSLLDVPGVGVGHATVHRDEAGPPAGRGVARTGVTTVVVAEDAYHRRIPAGGAVLNGAGECTGFLTAQEWGAAETPVYLTSTMQLGRVYDAACELEIEQDAAVADDVVIPIVGECDDSFLNDCRRMQVVADDVRAARDASLASRGAAEPPAEGAVGAGTGMSCYDFKGGIGTSSRVTAEGHTVAVLLLTNFGSRADLVVAGVPVGRILEQRRSSLTRPEAGSCIGLVVTDAPVDGASCQRLARRVGLGLARTGTVAHNGSGDIFLGFGTGMRLDRETGRPDRADLVSGPGLNALFSAVVEATEESVLNSLFTAPTVVGRDGNTSESLHSPEVLELLEGVRS
jgi:D-aminopeptidase